MIGQADIYLSMEGRRLIGKIISNASLQNLVIRIGFNLSIIKVTNQEASSLFKL